MVRAVIGGHIKVIGLVQKKFEALCGNPRWDAHMLVKAIEYGSLDAIRYLFRRGEVVMNTRTNLSDRALLLRLLYNGRIYRRPGIVNFLLENGTDPNGNELPKKKTPFEVAVKVRDFESGAVILKHGAAVNFKRMISMLLGITRKTDVTAALLQPLCPGGSSCRTYKSGGKSYTLCHDARDAKTIRNIENIFLDLGWSEQEVKAVEIEYFIDVN
ncbi:hypothetical protein PENCOP_c009G02113 [Penicillium coprophilum]|uniref:Uncharacterized protein n=1 Tax=Penicillium coprophilum TaxID=36646 RepID=A0A1V6UH48_9EURO|nr:hypothetical protein PENCOP_c009G02113 [Penicillium coprophilum]